MSAREKEETSLNVPDFDREVFEEVGVMHNKALKHALENAPVDLPKNEARKFAHSQLKISLPEAYKAFEDAEFPVDQNFERVLVSSNPDFISYFEENPNLSIPLKKYLIEMSEVILADLPIKEVNTQLNKLEDAAEKELTIEDLSVLFSSTSVAKYSTQFWYPESRGGEYGIKYLGRKNLELRKINWGKVILSDAAGVVVAAAGSVATSGGLTALPNPVLGGLPTASLWGVFGGASASIQSGINQ